ncbi:hypothetical protein [Luteimonas abyssi]|uniref:hypothetical protein n=1 Tax=Luteimonas abyssi TaxID=1247514 RepID=UPI000737D43C|nr:hypothetical protein [Luteimonas abyssi]
MGTVVVPHWHRDEGAVMADVWDQLWVVLAGVSGALLPLVLDDTPSRHRAMVRVSCGALVAVFVGPALNERFFVNADAHVQACTAFLVGCFGLQGTAILQRLLHRRGDHMADDLVARVTGRGRGEAP